MYSTVQIRITCTKRMTCPCDHSVCLSIVEWSSDTESNLIRIQGMKEGESNRLSFHAGMFHCSRNKLSSSFCFRTPQSPFLMQLHHVFQIG